MTVALDTNVLAYAEGVNGPEKKEAALAILDRLSPETGWLPTQALGELFNVLVRKAGFSRDQARVAILSWRDAFPLIPTSEFVMLRAADLAADHQFTIWDAVMLSAAIEAGCRLLLSEDMHDGFTSGGTTIVNPFAAIQHPHLAALLRPQAG
ncbi:MAG: PIN domain-containing protein [Acetobacteraceae bacterium]